MHGRVEDLSVLETVHMCAILSRLRGLKMDKAMKITLELPPDTEARLREHAARHDADGVRRLLADAFAPTVDSMLRETPPELTAAEFEALADDLAAGVAASRGPLAPALSDYAVSRAGIYEDHP